jgi:hypothetical protein
MANATLAQLEHTSQLVLYQLKETKGFLDSAWVELEIARSDLRDLMEIYETWEEEVELKKKRFFSR